MRRQPARPWQSSSSTGLRAPSTLRLSTRLEFVEANSAVRFVRGADELWVVLQVWMMTKRRTPPRAGPTASYVHHSTLLPPRCRRACTGDTNENCYSFLGLGYRLRGATGRHGHGGRFAAALGLSGEQYRLQAAGRR